MSNRGMTGLGVTFDVAAEIGARIKHAREKQQKNIHAIAGRIKVREQYLNAIEQGEWDELPRGLNGRGLVRNYARELSVPVPELEPNAVSSGEPVHPYEVTTAPTGETMVRETIKSVPRTPVFTQPQNQRPHTKQRTPIPAPKHGKGDDDIVTPDLMNILGITEDNLVKENPVSETQLRSDASAPVVDANDVIAQLIHEAPAEHPSSEPVPVISRESEERKARTDEPLHDTRSKKQKKKEKQRQKAQEQQMNDADDVAPLEMPQADKARTIESVASVDHTPIVPPLPVSSQGDEAITHETEATSQPAFVPSIPPVTESIGKTANLSAHQAQTSAPQTGSKLPWVVAAAFLILGAGAYLWLEESRRPVQEMLSTGEQSASAPVDSANTSNDMASAPLSENNETSADAVRENLPAVSNEVAPPASGAVDLGANTSIAADTNIAVSPPVAGQEAASNEQVVSAPTVQAVPTAEAIVEKKNEPVAVAPGTRSATLELVDEVEIRVLADGKVIYSGAKDAGKLPIHFKDKAEIFVKDGSKAKLSYEGWDHGILGHEGRRRRIVLSAYPLE